LTSNNYAAHFDVLVAKLLDVNVHSRVLSYLVTRALLRQLSGEHQLEAAHRVLQVTNIEQLDGIEDLPAWSDNLFDVCRIFTGSFDLPADVNRNIGYR
jgi:U3 small nucleolar RNA-associated protein 10